MRICGICRRAPRWDDPLSYRQFSPAVESPNWQFLMSAFGAENCHGTIGAMACMECLAKITGEPMAAPRIYPADQPIPLKPSSTDRRADIGICGLCRRATFEDDTLVNIRLADVDLIDELWRQYVEGTACAKQELLDTSAGFRAAFEKITAPDRERFAIAVEQAQTMLRQSLDNAIMHAETEQELAELEGKIQLEHTEKVNELEKDFQLRTAVPRAILDSQMSPLRLAYLRVAIPAFRTAQALCRGAEPDAKAGSYAVCRQCVQKYRPRIVERLKRQRLVMAEMNDRSVEMNWLM